MEITVRALPGGKYHEVRISDGNASIDSGTLDKDERRELRRQLLMAALELEDE